MDTTLPTSRSISQAMHNVILLISKHLRIVVVSPQCVCMYLGNVEEIFFTVSRLIK